MDFFRVAILIVALTLVVVLVGTVLSALQFGQSQAEQAVVALDTPVYNSASQEASWSPLAIVTVAFPKLLGYGQGWHVPLPEGGWALVGAVAVAVAVAGAIIVLLRLLSRVLS